MRSVPALTTLAILALSLAAAGPRTASLAVVGATLLDGTGREEVRDAVLVISEGRIQAVGSDVAIPVDAEQIDGRGKFVIPGLVDLHNHLLGGAFGSATDDLQRNLGQLLGWGVTATFAPSVDAAWFARLKNAAAADEAPLARFSGAGPGFGTIGGYAPQSPEEARARIRELRAAGVDAVKLAHDDFAWLTTRPRPALAPELVPVIVEEAHRQGLKAYVHAPQLGHAKAALRAGADGLLHGILSDPIDGELIALMRANQAFYLSTLGLFEDCADLAGFARRQQALDSRGWIAASVYASLQSPATARQWEAMWDNTSYTRARLPLLRENLRTILAAGIPVVIGSDTGFTGVLLGVATHLELLLHVEAGMDPSVVLRAASGGAARALGRESQLGTLEAGKLADLLVLEADPRLDIRNTLRLARVIKGGVAHDPQQLLR